MFYRFVGVPHLHRLSVEMDGVDALGMGENMLRTMESKTMCNQLLQFPAIRSISITRTGEGRKLQ